MPSHAAAAVTDEVSLTAVPANRPKPLVWLPLAAKSRENKRGDDVEQEDDADGLRDLLIVRIDNRAVAAIAEPPQIDDPAHQSGILVGI